MADTAKQPAADEWERMLSGELYVADSPQQHDANMRKRRLVQAINTSKYDAFKERDELFHELFGCLWRRRIRRATVQLRLWMQHVHRQEFLCQYGLHFP